MREEIMEPFKHLQIGKTPGPSDVYAEMIVASGAIEIRVLLELCQRILNGKGVPADWATSDSIPISIGKGDIMNCGMHRGVKLLEHVIKIFLKVLEKNCNNRLYAIWLYARKRYN